MQIYVFSSNNLTNVWAGVGAGMWAVSLKLAQNKGTITLSQRVSIGSFGILYCSKTHEFTTPFLFKTVPKDEVVTDVWPEEWGLHFHITPLGSPTKRLSKDDVQSEMPSLVKSKQQWNHLFRVQPTFSFQPIDINPEDWAYLFGKLAD